MVTKMWIKRSLQIWKDSGYHVESGGSRAAATSFSCFANIDCTVLRADDIP